MSFVNKYLRNFTPYKLASHKIWTVSPEERNDILKLDWNEAVISPSPKVIERLNNLVDDGSFYNLYPATYNSELMHLLSAYIELPEENIQYFASSDSLHEYIARLYITVGDPILLLGPTYDNFRLTAEVCGGKVYYFNIDETFYFDAEAFMRKIDDVDPSLVYICNPNNPTGTQHNTEFIRFLVERYPQILFLVDEAYAEFSGVSSKELVLDHENILISRTMSKAFALANFRFGYLIASKDNIAYISSIRNPKNITTFAQEAAIGALSDIDYMKDYVQEIDVGRKILCNVLDRYEEFLRYVCGGGNFLLLVMRNERDKIGLLEYFNNNNIFVRDVSQTEYLRQHCLRITIGTQEQMKRVGVVIGEYFEKYYVGKNRID